MTRFWIEMADAIALVLRGLQLMSGGEIFIPKLPTTDIETLAEAVAPGVPRSTVGIRPGEKLHETLISSEEARRTSDLGDVLVIWPEFQFHTTLNGVRPGTPVPEDFVYSSDRALPRLDLEATRAMVDRVA
jgi:UDP-N-acetylglucosamine 4,6-dehydratase